MSRELGVFSATMLGLGSILGTGIFVSIGVAAGAAGPAVILAIVLLPALPPATRFQARSWRRLTL